MPSKEEIKRKLCIDSHSPSYPLREFNEWLEQQHYQEVLRHLEQIQQELHAEDHAWRRANTHTTTEEKVKVSRWLFYCAQVKAYYQGLVFWR